MSPKLKMSVESSNSVLNVLKTWPSSNQFQVGINIDLQELEIYFKPSNNQFAYSLPRRKLSIASGLIVLSFNKRFSTSRILIRSISKSSKYSMFSSSFFWVLGKKRFQHCLNIKQRFFLFTRLSCLILFLPKVFFFRNYVRQHGTETLVKPASIFQILKLQREMVHGENVECNFLKSNLAERETNANYCSFLAMQTPFTRLVFVAGK